MPNWCYNNATITHENPTKIAELKQTLIADEPNTFEHFIPLPDGKWDYSFCVDNWGTKWEICHPTISHEDANTLSLYFETAWAPPIGVFEAMKKQGYVVHAEYTEEGMWFAGQWDDGDDECYKIDELPEHLSHLKPYDLDTDEEAA